MQPGRAFETWLKLLKQSSTTNASTSMSEMDDEEDPFAGLDILLTVTMTLFVPYLLMIFGTYACTICMFSFLLLSFSKHLITIGTGVYLMVIMQTMKQYFPLPINSLFLLIPSSIHHIEKIIPQGFIR